MPTVSAGSSGSYTFAEGEQVTISPDANESALVVISRGNVTLYGATVRGIETLGPYRAGDVMSLTAQRGAIDYTISAGVTSYAVSARGNSTAGYTLVVDSGALALSEVTPYVTRTATGTAFTGACELAGYDCTVAAGNITIYDNTSAAGTVIVPTTALALGRTEFVWKRALTNGCHVVLSGAATVNVLVG